MRELVAALMIITGLLMVTSCDKPPKKNLHNYQQIAFNQTTR